LAAVVAVATTAAVDDGPESLLPSTALSPLVAIMPVVTGHPLLRGMLDWFRATPPLAGGPRWYSMVSSRVGVLTNMGATSGWAATVRQGGQGEMRFDGVNDSVLLPGTGTGPLDLTGSFTLMAWVQPQSLATTNQNILNKGYTSATNSVQLYFAVGVTPATLVCGTYVSGTDHAVTAVTLLTAVWTHVACTFDGSTWSLYINGTLDAQAVTSGPAHTAANMAIGGQEEDGGAVLTGLWNGAMDDVLLWNRALSALDVRQAYHLSRKGWLGVLRRQSDLMAQGAAPVAVPSGRKGSFFPFLQREQPGGRQ
jgi:Concanavalin A-like lectin/glucanases superfamily